MLGATLVAVGLGLAAIGLPTFAIGLIPAGGFYAWMGAYGLATLATGRVNSLAFQHLMKGELDEAEALLRRGERSARGPLRRGHRILQALLALFRGDMDAAIAAATEASAPPTSLLERSLERRARAEALSIRALARAAAGHLAEATRDADAVLGALAAGPTALARAALARMVLAAQAGDLELLAALLREHARVTAALFPRERALVRAFRRMVAARGSGYRRPARTEGQSALVGAREWVGRVAPAAAAFVDGGERAAVGEVELGRPTEAVAASVPQKQQGIAKTAAGHAHLRRRIVFGTTLLVFFVGLYVLRTVGGDDPPEWVDVLPLVSTWAGIAVSAFMAVQVGRVVRSILAANQREDALVEGDRRLARGQLDAAADFYRPFLRDSNVLVRGRAHLRLAAIAEEQARFDESLREAEHGIALVEGHPALRPLASELLLPELHAAVAFAHAAAGRRDEANAELALIARAFPAYPFSEAASYRVRLVQAISASEWDGALDIAKQRNLELPLNLRDELLADLVLARSEGGSLGEGEQLRSELRADPVLASWVAAVAPGLSLDAPAGLARVATADGDDVSAHEGEDAPLLAPDPSRSA